MDESKVGKFLSLVVKGSTNRLANNRVRLEQSNNAITCHTFFLVKVGDELFGAYVCGILYV